MLLLEDGNVWIDLTERLALEKSISDVVEYRGQIYLACGDELTILARTGRAALEIVGRRAMEASALCANHFLWCIGGETVKQFDGTNWRTYECPANA